MKNKITLTAVAIFLLAAITQAQNGYIYVHKKTLDEVSSVDFTYNVTGGSTTVPAFTLNDQPTQVPLKDIGASQTGRLWAVSQANGLYYRDMGSSAWVQTTITNASRVDGGPANTCFYVTTGGLVVSYDGTTSTSLSTANTQHGSQNAVDIGSTWDSRPYICIASARTIWRYNGTGTAWTQVGTQTADKVDGNPSNGNVLAVLNSTNNIYNITSAGASTNLSKPAAANGTPFDVAVDANGVIYGNFAIGGGGLIFLWNGTAWSAQEATSGKSQAATAGIGGQAWMLEGGSSGSMNAPWGNIFTRTLNGANATWLDDERVRTTPISGNSEMIEVAPGTYTLTETVPSGWDLYSIDVSDPTSNSTSAVATNNATLTVAAGEVVHVVFTNGLVNTFAMTTSCIAEYTENFGTGATGTVGAALTAQTSYHYFGTVGTAAATTAGDDGQYKVVSRSNTDFAWWAAAINDHTAGDGTGRMMVVNASYDTIDFFRRRFTGIIPGATYKFSAWVASIFNTASSIKPNVKFKVIDPSNYSLVASTSTGNITSASVWGQYSITFVATTTTIDLVLSNNAPGGNGNDLALDDITFQLFPTTVTLATQPEDCGATGGKIDVTSPLGPTFEYSKDGTNWQTSPSFPNLTPGYYTIYSRFIGTTGCEGTKQDTIRPAICGTVFNDVNALTDDIVNGAPTSLSGALKIVLYDSTSMKVMQVVNVAADGTFKIIADSLGKKYTLFLTTTTPTIGQVALPTITLPAGYGNTGEDCCDDTGGDGTVNGVLPIGIINATTINANLGIQRLPESAVNTQTIGLNPGGTVNTPVNANWFATSNVGANPNTEDYDGGTVDSIRITAFPTNATSITINGTTYTSGTWPSGGVTIPAPGGVPSQTITVDPVDGLVSVVIPFVAKDNAGGEDATPGSVTLVYTSNLPVKWLSVSGSVNRQNYSTLLWRVNEVAVKYYEVERSTDGFNYTNTGTVTSLGNGDNSYEFTDRGNIPESVIYYRIKQSDNDGRYSYSSIIRLHKHPQDQLSIYPSPFKDGFTIISYKTQTAQLLNMQGRVIKTFYLKGGANYILASDISSGIYTLTTVGGTMQKLIKE